MIIFFFIKKLKDEDLFLFLRLEERGLFYFLYKNLIIKRMRFEVFFVFYECVEFVKTWLVGKGALYTKLGRKLKSNYHCNSIICCK